MRSETTLFITFWNMSAKLAGRSGAAPTTPKSQILPLKSPLHSPVHLSSILSPTCNILCSLPWKDALFLQSSSSSTSACPLSIFWTVCCLNEIIWGMELRGCRQACTGTSLLSSTEGPCTALWMSWILIVIWILSTGSSGRWIVSLWNGHKRLLRDFTLSVHLLLNILYLVLLHTNILSWSCIWPNVLQCHVCLLGLAKMDVERSCWHNFLSS